MKDQNKSVDIIRFNHKSFKKAQFKVMESIMALVFIIIILALVGVFVANSQINKSQSRIKDSAKEILSAGVFRVLSLPDFKCSMDYEYYCVDLQKALAIKEVSETNSSYRNFLRTIIGVDSEIRIISTYPIDFNFTFYNSTNPQGYKTRYVLNVPVLISNQSNYNSLGFGVIEVKGYLR